MAAVRRWPWYPALLAVGFVGIPFAETPIDVAAGARLLFLALILGLAVTATWVAMIGPDRGGVAAVLTLMGLVVATDLLRSLLVAAALVLILVERTWWRRGTMRLLVPWVKLTAVLNAVLAVFIAIQVGRGVITRATVPEIPQPAGWSVATDRTLPDIFLIVADAHGRDDVLMDRYGYDMANLRDVLVADEFEESPRSYANHSTTRFSLSVLLNGRPLSELGQDMSAPPDERIPFAAMLQSSGLHMLREAGYEVTVVSSGYEHLTLHDVDRYIDVGPRTEEEQATMLRSGAGRLLDGLTGGYVDAAATRVLRQLDTVRSIARETPDRPQFVLAHLPLPHWPFVLNADCSTRPFDAYTPGTQARGWIRGNETAVRLSADQTRCIDSLLADAVPDLVAARPGAVVVLLSDHGPEEHLDWWHPDAEATDDRLANLFWARTPGRKHAFPEDITLVNVLPILANTYMGTDLPLHSNDLYLGPSEPVPAFVPYSPPTGPASFVTGTEPR